MVPPCFRRTLLQRREVAAWQPSSSQTTRILLHLKASRGRQEALQKQRDEETKKQSEHDMNMMSLKQAIALCENNVDDAKKERARLAQEKAEAEKELADVEASKAA